MVSVIIVNYKSQKELFACVQSIMHAKNSVPFEIIVVDNEEKKSDLQRVLKRKFPKVRYIKNERNTGWGGGTNVGVEHAKGKYIYFLNPDTILEKHAIDHVYTFLKQRKDVGVAASLLHDSKDNIYGSKKLTPVSALRYFTPLRKIFHDSYGTTKEALPVDVAPLAAALIRKEVFQKAGRFDERFFLYFEEHDLAMRLRKLGLKNFIVTKSNVFHAVGQSTKHRSDAHHIFEKSRLLYFQKYYGRMSAFIVDMLLRIRVVHILLFLILVAGAFLRFFRLGELMMFIGDQGWFYLSARDFLLTGNIPLVGITSSHTWLHQGPLWTYMLAGALWIGNFHPVSGAVLSGAIGVLSIIALYVVAEKMFSEKVALIAAAIFAISPLAVIHARFAYHTSPIPLFIILFLYAHYRWIQGSGIYFSLTVLLLGILYQLELATQVLWLLPLGALGIGFVKKTQYFKSILNVRVIAAAFAWLISIMLPIILYDLENGFKQTVVFGGWIIYKVATVFGFPQLKPSIEGASYTELVLFSQEYIRRFLFVGNSFFAGFLFVTSVFFLSGELYLQFTKRGMSKSYILLGAVFFTLTAGFFVAKTPSEAYLPMFFPIVALTTAVFIRYLFTKQATKHIAFIGLIVLVIGNGYQLLKNEFYSAQPNAYGPAFQNRLDAARAIIQDAKGSTFTISGYGPGSQFRSFTMNYEYLVWWMGEPVSANAQYEYTISETYDHVTVRKVDMLQ